MLIHKADIVARMSLTAPHKIPIPHLFFGCIEPHPHGAAYWIVSPNPHGLTITVSAVVVYGSPNLIENDSADMMNISDW